MRTLLPTLLLAFLQLDGHTQDTTSARSAKIEFESTLYDYGTIAHAANGECTFKYTNTGHAPLVITNCRSSCGCVVPRWDPEPLLPGKTSTVRVKYDMKRPGPFTKSVTVECNAANTPSVVLTIKGHVLPPVETMPADTTQHIDH
ncbi:MAG: DUF1573 domain-containing protein [Flavobacteriales bacterium]|nr:DUF1573 domain-containing protein [Flavobacteriales bacterium]